MNKLAIGAIALWLVSAAALGVVFLRGQTTQGSDGRKSIALQDDERNFLLGEMRKMLIGVQQITEGLAENDKAKIVRAAKAASEHGADGPPAALMMKLPMEFKQTGMAMHGEFADLAKAAESEKAEAAALSGRLAKLMNACVGCHESFRVDSAR